MNNNEVKPYLLTQNKSLHHFQYKHEPSPRKTHRKEMEQHSSPQHNSTSLSFSKSQLHIVTQQPKSQNSHHESTYVALLIQQIRNLEATVESLKEENERLKLQTISYLDVQFQHKQLNKYHDLLKCVQSLKLDNLKIKKQYEQMQLMMKIHLAPINEMFLQLKQTNNHENKQSLADFPMKDDSRIETTPNEVKIYANINKYQKCKTETQLRDQK